MTQIKQLNRTPADVPPAELTPFPGNYRHGDTEAIAESIRVNGFYNPLIVQASTGYVIAGNHRLAAAISLGLETVPVIYLEVDDTEARRILVADNTTSDKGVNDDLAMGRIIAEVYDEDEHTKGLGLDAEEARDYLLIVAADEAEQTRLAAAQDSNPFDWRGAAPETPGQAQPVVATKGAPVPGRDAPEPSTAPAPAPPAPRPNDARRVFLLDLPLPAYAWLRSRLDELAEERELEDDIDVILDLAAEATGTTAPYLSRADKRISDPSTDGIPTT